MFVIFDLETTDRNSKLAEIIEISALKIDNGNIVGEFSSLVKPSGSINPEAAAINNISLEMVNNAPPISNILPGFIEFIGNYQLVGYNISSFDLPILRRVLKDTLNLELNNNYIDVLLLARERLPFLPNRSLTTVAAYFNICASGAHRALKDCYITYQCFEKLLCLEPCVKAEKKNNGHKHFRNFSEQTKALQTLQGFLLGVIADNKLSEEEVYALKKWLSENNDLSGQYPFDRVFSVINNALIDEILDQNELKEMLDLFKKYTTPTEFCSCSTYNFSLTDKIVCLTGDFEYGSRKAVEDLVVQAGGICKNSVSGKTDYVIVGNLGSPDWSCGNYGTKIKKALELQEKGNNIQIIKEEDFFIILDNQEATVNETLSIFGNDQIIFYQKIQQILDDIINSHDLPENSIHLYSNISSKGENAGKETSKSICIFEPEYPPREHVKKTLGKNFIIMNIKNLDNNRYELLIRPKQHTAIDLPVSAIQKETKTDQNFLHFIFNSNDSSVLDYIRKNILYCLSNYEATSSFGCCSRFIECSDAKKCVHVNKIYSMGCKYRKNLDAGKIFYGKNKNI